MLVVVSGVDELNDGVEKEFMGDVLAFSWAGEKGVYYLEGGERVGCDFEVVVVLELDECHVDGSKFSSEYDVVFVEACGVNHDGNGGWFVYDCGS